MNQQYYMYALHNIVCVITVEFTALFLLFQKSYFYSFGGVKFTPSGVKVKMHAKIIELNKTGTLPPTGNLKPNFRGSPQSRHAGKSAAKRQNKVFEKEKSK